MASIYVLHSASRNRFYVGSCRDLAQRIDQHLSKHFPGAYTSTAKDWVIYFYKDGLAYHQARKIELHLKKMKSRKYFESLKKYPKLFERLVTRYQR